MRSHLFLALLLPLLIALPAQAQIYKWKDAQGRTVISDTPQPGAGKQVPVVRQAPAAAQDAAEGEPAAAAGPKSWAEKDLEFRQRQQEKRASAEKAAKEKAEADQRRDNCNRAREQQRILESGQRISRMKEDGEREFISDQQRQQEIERAIKNVQEWCK